MNASSALSIGDVARRRRNGTRMRTASTTPMPNTISPTKNGVPGMWR